MAEFIDGIALTVTGQCAPLPHVIPTARRVSFDTPSIPLICEIRIARDHNLMASEAPGHQVEDYARRLAGDLGVRDFVYRPVLLRKGNAVREVSDGLLVAGDRGLILQVKSRHPDVSAHDTPAKAAGWCVKNAAEAVRQAEGTRRSLSTTAVAVRSLRGFERTLPDASTWPVVAIIDHPADSDAEFPHTPNTLYISLSDWRNLHRWLRSTWGVVDYVHRALESGVHVRLGDEQPRYTILCDADIRAIGSPTSFPTLPPYCIGGAEALDASLVEDLIEKLADPEGATGWDAQQYLWIVEELDRLPVLARVRIGAKMRTTFLAMNEAKARRSFMVLDPSDPRVRIAFLYDYDDAATECPDDWFMAQVANYGALRHQHALAAGADASSATLAVGVLHHPQRGRRYAFFYVAATDLQLSAIK